MNKIDQTLTNPVIEIGTLKSVTELSEQLGNIAFSVKKLARRK